MPWKKGSILRSLFLIGSRDARVMIPILVSILQGVHLILDCLLPVNDRWKMVSPSDVTTSRWLQLSEHHVPGILKF